MDGLLPCPFCGYEAVIELVKSRKGYDAVAHCNGCLASIHTITYDTENEAISNATKEWNNRAEVEGLKAQVAMLREAIQLGTEEALKPGISLRVWALGVAKHALKTSDAKPYHNPSDIAEIERLKSEINQHIKWNEAHTKARVESSEQIAALTRDKDEQAGKIMRAEYEIKNLERLVRETNELFEMICIKFEGNQGFITQEFFEKLKKLAESIKAEMSKEWDDGVFGGGKDGV